MQRWYLYIRVRLTLALKEEGLYRLSGSSAAIQTLKDKFNTEGDYNILADEDFTDVHAVTGLLKLFLRELPENILTTELQREFHKIPSLMDRNMRIKALSELIPLLPTPNRTLLQVLCSHLIRVVRHSEINKMTVRNISIVFSPTLNINAGILTLMMAEYGAIFSGHSLEECGLVPSLRSRAEPRRNKGKVPLDVYVIYLRINISLNAHDFTNQNSIFGSQQLHCDDSEKPIETMNSGNILAVNVNGINLSIGSAENIQAVTISNSDIALTGSGNVLDANSNSFKASTDAVQEEGPNVLLVDEEERTDVSIRKL
jgi:hypothetical protein